MSSTTRPSWLPPKGHGDEPEAVYLHLASMVQDLEREAAEYVDRARAVQLAIDAIKTAHGRTRPTTTRVLPIDNGTDEIRTFEPAPGP